MRRLKSSISVSGSGAVWFLRDSGPPSRVKLVHEGASEEIGSSQEAKASQTKTAGGREPSPREDR